MKLSVITRDNFDYLERWVNEPKYSTTALYSEVAPYYHPRFGAAAFALPYKVMPRTAVEIFEAHPSPDLRRYLVSGRQVKFFYHPEAGADFCWPKRTSEDGSVMVAPTASTRTVITKSIEPAIFIKLHCNKRISRFIRRLTRNSIVHSLQISRACEELSKRRDCPKALAFLPETIGVNLKRKNLGFIIREHLPRPEVSSQRFLIPFFALHSSDQKRPHDAPLLKQLLKKHGGKNPAAFFAEKILAPFIRVWAYGLTSGGMLFESHGQNTLLEVDSAIYPRRIVQRDFQSLPIDPVIRRRLRLPLPFSKHIIGREDYPPRLEHSLMYDHFVGDYLLSALAEFFHQQYHLPEREFCRLTRKIFRRYIPASFERQFFPAGHVSFGPTIKGNRCALMYWSEQPKFRPGGGAYY